MTRTSLLRYCAIALLILVGAAIPSSEPHAAARMLDRLEVRSEGPSSEVHVAFNHPLRYITHAPAAQGDFLQIELRLISTDGAEAQEPTDREALSWKPSAAVPLVEVSYERISLQSARLTLRFARPVRYSVKGGSDFRSVVVALAAAADVAPREAPEQAPRPAVQSTGEAPAPPQAASEAAAEPAAGAAPEPARPPVSVGPEAAPVGPVTPAEFDAASRYAISLESSRRAVPSAVPPELGALRRFRLYTTRFVKDDSVWNRLRLGFFPTKEAAEKVRASLLDAYPGAWVTKVSPEERARSAESIVALPTPAPSEPEAPPEGDRREVETRAAEPAAGTTATPDELSKLMTEAAAAMTAGDVRRAIQLYTKVLRAPDSEHRQEAQELLGLARERNNQLAHAKAEYEEYLRRYPEGEGAERVRQRLAGLLTARARPKQKLRPAKASAQEPDVVWGLAGSLAQQYFRDERFTDIEGRIVDRSDLNTNLDFTGSVGDDRYEANLRFSGAHSRDFSEPGSMEDGRLSALYVDLFDSQTELFGRIGRQSRSSGGVLGRHDGALLSYQASPKIKVNGVAGFPVTTTKGIAFNRDRYFYGLSLDLGTFAERWDGNLFVINQDVDGLTDRRAVGGEVRYFAPNLSAFGLLDYDIFYNSLNIALLNGNYVFPDGTTVNLSLNYRNSPILTTTNALQGQGVDSVSELLDSFSEGEVHRLAEQRTAISRSITIGASRPLNDTFQISADVTATDLSDTEPSGDVAAIPGTGVEFYYATQLIGSSVIKEGDIAILGFRYADTDRFDRYTIDLNTRYPVNRAFRVSPRLRTDYRLDKDDDDTQLSVRPSIRLIYYWDRALQFELDIGGEWLRDRNDGRSVDTLGLFGNIGYRFDF